MDVRVDSWAWLPKAELSPDQIVNMERMLTVRPRKVGDFPGDDPSPIPLFVHAKGYFGVPRQFFFENRRPHHRVDLQVTDGAKDWHPAPFVGQLRPEQKLASDEVQAQFGAGRLGGIVEAKPGWGKTVQALEISARLNVPTLVVVHKEFLMDQWIERVQKFRPDARIGRVQQDVCDFRGKTIVMGMVHSLGAGEGYPLDLWTWPGLIITDECFVGDQRVVTTEGPKPIREVAVGDTVVTAYGEGEVLEVHRRVAPLRKMCAVHWEGGTAVCTVSHPFLTLRGWVPAALLQETDYLLTTAGCTDITQCDGNSFDTEYVRLVREAEVGTEGAAVLFPEVHGHEQTGAAGVVSRVPQGSCEAEERSFLLHELSKELDEAVAGVRGAEGTHIPVTPGGVPYESGTGESIVGSHEGCQSDAGPGSARESSHRAQREGALPSSPRGERDRAHGASAQTSGNAGLRVGGRTCGSDRSQEGRGHEATSTVPLQDRLSVSGEGLSGRGGWAVAQHAKTEGSRSEKGRFSSFRRVVGVSNLERNGVGQLSALEGVCDSRGEAGIVVYNLSVKGHPSYALAGEKGAVVVHNCHRIGAYTWSGVPAKFNARYRLGYTATPRRKDGADAVFWKQIGPIIFAGKEERLKPKVKRVWTKFKLVKTDRFNPQLAPRSLLIRFLCASRHRNALIVEQISAAVAAGRKCLILSERLKHLADLEAQLCREWPVQAGPVSTGKYVGGQKKNQLEEAAKARVIFATIQYAAEGLDIPALDTLFLTTPMSDVEQAVGRIQRPHEGKKDPIVVDFRDDAVPMLEAMGRKRDRFYEAVT